MKLLEAASTSAQRRSAQRASIHRYNTPIRRCTPVGCEASLARLLASHEANNVMARNDISLDHILHFVHRRHAGSLP